MKVMSFKKVGVGFVGYSGFFIMVAGRYFIGF